MASSETTKQAFKGLLCLSFHSYLPVKSSNDKLLLTDTISMIVSIRSIGIFLLFPHFMHHLGFLSSFPYSSKLSLSETIVYLTWKIDSSKTNYIKWGKNLNLNYGIINSKTISRIIILEALLFSFNNLF